MAPQRNICCQRQALYKWLATSARRELSSTCTATPATPAKPGVPLKIAFVSAGGVNFGSEEGTWDHASRLEDIPKHVADISFVGIVDPDISKARYRLYKRANGRNSAQWAKARVFRNVPQLLSYVKPDAVIIGTPPHVRGQTSPPLDAELRCAQLGIHVFVEKPISVAPVSEVRSLMEGLQQAQKEHGIVTSVGYQLRYSHAVRKMKDILKDHTIAAIIARYNSAYEKIKKPFFWDRRTSGGPVVEQATHFVDLMRLLGGEVVVPTIRTVVVPESAPAGELSMLSLPPFADHAVPPEFRNPRVTSSSWSFESGAVGTLVHGMLLHGDLFYTELEVWADGLLVRLADPYRNPTLTVRWPGYDKTETINLDPATEDKDQLMPDYQGKWPAHDVYSKEMIAFIHAIVTKDRSVIQSPYEDAFKTYVTTCNIRDAAGK